MCAEEGTLSEIEGSAHLVAGETLCERHPLLFICSTLVRSDCSITTDIDDAMH